MKKTLLLLLSFCSTLAIAQTTITSAQTGNWDVTSTWVGGSVPSNGDNIVIDDGHDVT